MRISDVMASEVTTVSPDSSLSDAADLMRARRVRYLPVINRGRLVGLLSDLDLDAAWPSAATTLDVREIPYQLARVRVDSVMTRDVATVRPEAPILEAARLMRDWRIRALPVVRLGRVVGIVTEGDLLARIPALLDERESRRRDQGEPPAPDG